MSTKLRQINNALRTLFHAVSKRKEAYAKALSIYEKKDLKNQMYRECYKDTYHSLNILEKRINDINQNVNDTDTEHHNPGISEMYYAFAKSTSNLLTISLSVKLGDLVLVKTIEDLLKQTDLDDITCIKLEIMDVLSRLKKSSEKLALI